MVERRTVRHINPLKDEKPDQFLRFLPVVIRDRKEKLRCLSDPVLFFTRKRNSSVLLVVYSEVSTLVEVTLTIPEKDKNFGKVSNEQQMLSGTFVYSVL